MAKKYEGLAKILAIVGAIVALLEAILGMAGVFAAGAAVGGIVGQIVSLLLALILAYAVFKPNDPIPYNKIVLIVIGIVMLIMASRIGGALALIAGILLAI